MRRQIIELLKDYKDCVAWDYNEMLDLNRDLVELKLPIRPDKKHVKKLPRSFSLEIISKIKEEIKRLLRSRFIRIAKYVE